MKTTLIYIASWPGMVSLAILNGLIREKVYGPSMSELSAHQLSSLIAIILFGLYIYGMTVLFAIRSGGQALLIGGIWFVDYNLLAGRVWLLVLLWTTIAPYLFFRLRT